MVAREGVSELCVISMERFEDLIDKATQLNLVKKIYFNAASYNLQDTLSAVFGPVPKKDDKDVESD